MSHAASRPACPPLLVSVVGAILTVVVGGVNAAGAATAPGPAPTVVVVVSTLNLRAGPRLSAPSLRRLPRGTHLRVLFYRVSWVAVAAPDATIGYVDRYGVRPLPVAPRAAVPASPASPALSSPAARPPFRPPYLTVAAATANLRSAPALTALVLAVLPRRTPLALLGSRGTWARVVTRGGRVGWVARYLTRAV